jgi:hypothetical protein
MTLDDIISMTQNRLAALNTARTAAFLAGDIAQVNIIDVEMLKTQTTLDQLLSVKAAQ